MLVIGFRAHATPMRALVAAYDPIPGVVESVPFARAVSSLSEVPVGQGGGFDGWYLTRTLWGWHVGRLWECGDEPRRCADRLVVCHAHGKTLL